MKLFPILFSLLLLSCSKFTEVDLPADQVVNPLPFSTDATATATVTGIYSEMLNSQTQFSAGYTTFFAGMSADELTYYGPSFRDEFIKNNITAANHPNLSSYFWAPAYRYIYAANVALEQLERSQSLSATMKSQLMGEAKFIRAFCFFQLVNLFGEVPLTLSTDYRVNMTLPKAAVEKVFDQITADLVAARSLMATVYPATEKVRPNRWAAAALLARVYLYQSNWALAEAEATAVINAGIYSLESDAARVFLKGSTETIWQLRPVNPAFNTYEGNAIIPSTSTKAPAYLLTDTLVRSFQIGDKRKAAWVASRTYLGQTLYYPYKYKVFGGSNVPVTEYYVVLRLAELYLIRAEARARQNNIAGALEDLNTLRSRAGLPGLSVAAVPALLAAIEQERKVELFAEWGHRWMDLKRTGRAGAVLAGIKGISWQATDVLWPIPGDQIKLNAELTQNPGY